jgi:hypothetical protein
MIGRVLLVCLVTLCAFGVSVSARAQQFERGDVIVSGEIPTGGTQEFDYKLLCYRSNGQLKTVLSDGPFFDFGRLAFSPRGVLHATTLRGIETVSPTGQITGGLYGSDIFRGLAFTEDGSLVAGAGRSMSKFNASGALLNAYSLPDDADVISIDIDADQCTAYWVGSGVRRFDICRGTQLSDFATSPPVIGGGDFRILPGGGMAISRTDGIEIYGANGFLLRKIPVLLGAIALDVDSTSIWLAEGGSLFKYDIATGNVLLGPVATGLAGVDGLTVYGEPRAAFVNGALAAIPVFSQSILLVLCAALAALALVRLRV